MPIYRQRKFGVKTRFDFDGERLGYSIGDVLSSRSEAVDYEILDFPHRGEFEIANNAFLMRWTVLPLFMVFALLAFSDRWPLGDQFYIGIIGFSLAAMLLMFTAMAREWTTVTFTEIPTFGVASDGARPAIRIIQGDQHDRILEEFGQHWRNRMRALHFHLNLEADPMWEERKFDELLRNDIISAGEHREMLEALRAGRPSMSTH